MKSRNRRMNRRAFLSLLGLSSISMVGCAWDGHFNLLGYSTRPNYDDSIQTVYIPIFQNRAFQTTPHREMEAHLHRAVIREIESRTPYKVIDDPERADTELIGTIMSFNKNVLNITQQNTAREIEYSLTVEVVWRHSDGRVLSNPRRAEGTLDVQEIPAFDPNNVPLARGPEVPTPVRIITTSRAIPELGESSSTGEKMAVDRMAVKIAELMEKPWKLNRDR